MPEHVERTVRFEGRSMQYANVQDASGMRVTFRGAAGGAPIAADFAVRPPAGQESLNVVVPWTRDRFQQNSKHAALPCEGFVDVGGERWAMEPDTCHAVQDFGRGRWPYRSFWNWGVATGVQDGVRIAVNVGGKWTTGTGVNENGILVDGRLHKVMEDVRWDYDPDDWMRRGARRGDRDDLTLEPIVAHRTRTSSLLSTGGGAFRRWHGRSASTGARSVSRGSWAGGRSSRIAGELETRTYSIDHRELLLVPQLASGRSSPMSVDKGASWRRPAPEGHA
jgi:hypothetical protein